MTRTSYRDAATIGLWVAGVLGSGGVALAAPQPDPGYGDFSVIQRDRPIVISGDARPGEGVTVTLGAVQVRVQADGEGRFRAPFAPVAQAGPIALGIEDASGRTDVRDVMIGDVFLCSGQSNMELPVEAAQNAAGQMAASADEGLRLITIPKRIADTPQVRFGDRPVWHKAGSDSVRGFSAACYYMVRALRRSAAVPIGAIAASWGGSQIATWMGAGAQAAVGQGDRSALLAMHARDPEAAERTASAQWEEWWRARTGDQPGHEPWRAPAALSWTAVPNIGPWEAWGDAALASYDGMVWFQREVTLTAAQARQPAVLDLGTMDDVGRLWINGTGVGMTARAWQPSRFAVPGGLLRPGRNILIVNVQDGYANGGMEGPAEAMRLTLADGSGLPLGDGWSYAVARRSPTDFPRVPWSDLAGAGAAYHAMIAPLGGIGLKGVAWYQGESDADIPGYADRLAAMVADWRRQFGQPLLPFAIVQLAGYGAASTGPAESGWATLRDDQRRVVEGDPSLGLATAIDIGDPYDIHPGEKQELGRRLARVMEAIAYGAPVPRMGPQIRAAVATADGAIRLSFSGVTGGLHLRSGDRAIAFELCGTQSGSCRYAAGRVDGDTVLLTSDGREAVKIRYGWAGSPVLNLYDATPLPIGPFECVILEN